MALDSGQYSPHWPLIHMTPDEVVRADVLGKLYGHHVDVLNVHGRVLIVAGAGEDTDLAGHEVAFPDTEIVS